MNHDVEVGWPYSCKQPKSNYIAIETEALSMRSTRAGYKIVSLAPLMACRLIALNKNPGVRPIGVCGTIRRIIAKAVLSVTGADIQDAAGTVQLCAGQKSGTEAAVHAMNLAFKEENSEAVLLVDASNAFNSLNRQIALRNIRTLCPSISTMLINSYRKDPELFVGGTTIHSKEGTTQGDPLAMPMYAIALLPLIKKVNPHCSVTQAWYADDASATGHLSDLRSWWDALVFHGPAYGYHVNASKTYLITKESSFANATTIFGDTQIKITSDGHSYLGSPLGTSSFRESYVQEKVARWCHELKLLCSIAETSPQAAYAAFTHGLVNKWSYLSRTTENIGPLLQPLEDIIRTELIPTLSSRPAPNDKERDLLALPCRLGGLGLTNPSTTASEEFSASKNVTKPLVDLILAQESSYPYEAHAEQLSAVSGVKKRKRAIQNTQASSVRANLPIELQRAMDLSQEKGASNWLTVLPVEEFRFSLHKSAFRDALALRYGWQLINTPSSCSCGHNFSVEHAFSCPTGGYPSIRHNEIRDFTAHLLSEVCHNVAIEPHLQPLQGEALHNQSSNRQNGARLDIAADGFWGSRHERAFFDVRVFNPYAPSNRNSQLTTCYRSHENAKKRSYDQRIREVEHGSFTPLVLSCTGGMGRAAINTYKRLATLISTKRDDIYSNTMGWIRCRLSFSLLRAAIMSIRGARSTIGHATREPEAPTDLITRVCHIPVLD